MFCPFSTQWMLTASRISSSRWTVVAPSCSRALTYGIVDIWGRLWLDPVCRYLAGPHGVPSACPSTPYGHNWVRGAAVLALLDAAESRWSGFVLVDRQLSTISSVIARLRRCRNTGACLSTDSSTAEFQPAGHVLRYVLGCSGCVASGPMSEAHLRFLSEFEPYKVLVRWRCISLPWFGAAAAVTVFRRKFVRCDAVLRCRSTCDMRRHI